MTAPGALSPHITLLVGFGLSCARRVYVETVKHVSWACVGARTRFVAQFLRAWVRLKAEQEIENRHIYGCLNDRVHVALSD